MEDFLMGVAVIVIGILALLSFFDPDSIWVWHKFLNDSRSVQTKPKTESWKADQKFNGVLYLIVLAAVLVLYFSNR